MAARIIYNGHAFAGSTSGTVTLLATAVAGSGTAFLPVISGTDTLVANALAATLSNKTFVAPILGTPTSGVLTNCTGLPVGAITGLGSGIATFLATNNSANIAAAGMQPLSGELTSLAAAVRIDAIYYRVSTSTWLNVKIGAGMKFASGTISSFTVASQVPAADQTVASAATLDLSGSAGPVIAVTGTTGITAITLADGEERTIQFAGALTLTQGTNLQLPGGRNLTTTANGFATVRASAGVKTVFGYVNGTNYKVETFDKLWMNDGANIGFTSIGSAFSVGGGTANLYLQFLSGVSTIQVIRPSDATTGQISMDLVPAGATVNYNLPAHDGTFSTLAGTEDLTNKGINGFGEGAFAARLNLAIIL